MHGQKRWLLVCVVLIHKLYLVVWVKSFMCSLVALCQAHNGLFVVLESCTGTKYVSCFLALID